VGIHLRTNPIYASIMGDKRYNDKLDDFSQAAIDNNLEQTQKFLDRDSKPSTPAAFPNRKLNKELMVRDLKMGSRVRGSSPGRCRFQPGGRRSH
jgi:hypothetical protein